MNMYSYRESLKKQMIESVKELFKLETVTSNLTDKLMENGVLKLQSEIITIDNTIYRKCTVINMETKQSRVFTVKLNNR